MEVHIHLHHHYHNRKVLSKLDQIIEIMAKSKADFDAQLTRIEQGNAQIADSLTNVADDVRRLTEGMTPTGGLTEAEATEIFDSLAAKADTLDSIAQQIKALADQTPEPNPNPEV